MLLLIKSKRKKGESEMKKGKGDTILVLLLLLVILGAGGVGYWKYRQNGGTPILEMFQKKEPELARITEYQSLTKNFDETGKVEGKIHIGDYVSYIPQGQSTYSLSGRNTGNNDSQNIERDTTLKWRVFGVSKDKTQLLLISDKPTDGEYVSFKGADGYNNIVYALNDICETLYSNPDLGLARSIKMEDVQPHLSSSCDFSAYDNGVTKYGETMEYTQTDTIRYPVVFAKEIGQTIDGKEGKELAESEQKNMVNGVKTANQNITVKQTFWKKKVDASDFTANIYYELLVNNGSNYKEYYLASRCVDTTKDYPKFCQRRIGYGSITGDTLYFKPGEVLNMAQIRPMIELEMNVKVDMSTKETSGTETNPWLLQPSNTVSNEI